MLTIKQSLYSAKSTLLAHMLNRKGALPLLKAYDNKHHPERVGEWYEIKKITKKEEPYFLVFRSHPTDGFGGLGSYLVSFLSCLKLHEMDNFIPVVDFQTSPPKTLYDEEPELRNYWEDYFEQPAGVSVEEAMSSNNYVLSGVQDRVPGLLDITKKMMDSVLTNTGGGVSRCPIWSSEKVYTFK